MVPHRCRGWVILLMGNRLSSGRWFHDKGATNRVLDVAGLTEGRLRYAPPRSQTRNSRS